MPRLPLRRVGGAQFSPAFQRRVNHGWKSVETRWNAWVEPDGTAGFISTYNGEQHKSKSRRRQSADVSFQPTMASNTKSESHRRQSVEISLQPTAVASVRARMLQTASAPWTAVNDPPTSAVGISGKSDRALRRLA
jgi:hypothetical protein